MSSFHIRNQQADHLLTPENSMLVVIDYQPVQMNSIQSMNQRKLEANICALAQFCIDFKMPIVLTTVNVQSITNRDTIAPLKKILSNLKSYDRSGINAWEDQEVREAIIAEKRNKVILCALWTEACLSFPALDMLKEKFEVYPVVDAVGGTSVSAHKTALRRMEQAGAKLTNVAQVACEIQRDWNRKETAPFMVKCLTQVGAFSDY